MSVYPEKISMRLRNLAHRAKRGPFENVGTGVAFECGCFVKIGLQIESETQTIDRAGFSTNGCGYAAAAADAVAGGLAGKKLTELHGTSGSEIDEACEAVLGTFPAQRRHCITMAADALRNALAEHRTNLLEEFKGEQALICTCFGVTEDRIAAVIAANGLTEVEEVSAICNAGSGCGSCRMLIREMLDAAALEGG